MQEANVRKNRFGYYCHINCRLIETPPMQNSFILYTYISIYHVNSSNYLKFTAWNVFDVKLTQKHATWFIRSFVHLLLLLYEKFCNFTEYFIIVVLGILLLRTPYNIHFLVCLLLFSVQVYFDIVPPQPVNSWKFINYNRSI